MTKINKYYFTFGSSHPLANYYYIIKARTSAEAREEMFKQFGNKWSMQYDSAEKAGVKEFGLKELP